jgi:proteasome lid subunit RPN8/RPN11
VSDAAAADFAPGVFETIRAHCESDYPHEACGALLGRGDGTTAPWRVTHALAAPNEHADDRRRRYLVAPEFQLEAERRARADGLDVLGYYHSHPDHHAQPSEYDRACAWFGYLYVICEVRNGHSRDATAWTLDEPDGRFLPVPIPALDDSST